MRGPDAELTLERLRGIQARIEAMGLPWKTSRFARYIEVLEHLTDPPPGFFDQANDKGNEVRALIMEGANQTLQLQLAARTFDHLDQDLLKRSLKKVLRGKPLEENEDDEPRNTLLEFVAAATALDLGFSISLTAVDEDVRLDHPEIGRGAIECKRPLHAGTLLKNLNKIGDQLREREKTGSTYGFAVIGADRMLGLNTGKIYSCKDLAEEHDVTTRFSNLATAAILEASRDPKCRLVPPGLIGITVLASAVTVDEPRAVRPLIRVSPFPLVPPERLPPGLDRLLRDPPSGPMAEFRSDPG